MNEDEEMPLPEKGAVFTFGRSRFNDGVASRFWIKNDRVVQCSCGDSHTAILTESRRVFVFGANEFSQLGLGHTATVTRPTCIKVLKTEPITHVACGKGHTMVAAENGRMYGFGLNQDGQLGLGHTDGATVPSLVPDWSQSVRQLQAGIAHTVLLTTDGEVYVWGSNADGQCGLGEVERILRPTKLVCPEPISQISCGYRHTAMISDLGCLYVMGENEAGQLGLGCFSKQKHPVAVLAVKNLQKVACGGLHTLALTKYGDVYVFGTGSEGQLGLGSHVMATLSPVKLALQTFAVDVSAGHSHSAILTESNQLLMFGDSRYGKLCFRDIPDSNVYTPHPVNTIEEVVIQNAELGGNQTMVMVVPQSNTDDLVISLLNTSSQQKMPLPDPKTEPLSQKPENQSPLSLTRSALEILTQKSKSLPPLKGKKNRSSSTAGDPDAKRKTVQDPNTSQLDRLSDGGSQRKETASELQEVENEEETELPSNTVNTNTSKYNFSGKLSKVFGQLKKKPPSEENHGQAETENLKKDTRRSPSECRKKDGAARADVNPEENCRKVFAEVEDEMEDEEEEEETVEGVKKKESTKNKGPPDDDNRNQPKRSVLDKKSKLCSIM